MNAGIYGLPNGQAGGIRKLVGRLGHQTGTASATLSPAAAFRIFANANLNALAMSAGVRTRVVTVTGRGAIRAAAAEAAFASPPPGSMRMELWIDGLLVIDTGAISPLPSGAGGITLVGSASESNSTRSASLDYIPFESSSEIWITRSVAETIQFAYLIDIHQ